MVIDLSNLSVSDYAAWWGATIATLALVWNIVFALRAGARLHISISKDMEFFPPMLGEEGKKQIVLRAVNRGTSPTTITHFLGYSDKNWWTKFTRRKKNRQHFIVNPGVGSSPIPMKLEPGDEWTGFVDQDGILNGIGAKYVFLGVAHNQQKKSVYERVNVSA